MENLLLFLQRLLKENDKPSKLEKAKGEILNDRLLVALGNMDEGQEGVMEITEYLPSVQETPTQDALLMIQFQYVLDVNVTPDTFNQVSSALHFFNRMIHCPGFELDELNNKILYRYMWFINKKGIDSLLLLQVLGNLHVCYKMFSPYIKEIAQGKYTLEDILEQVASLAPKPKP